MVRHLLLALVPEPNVLWTVAVFLYASIGVVHADDAAKAARAHLIEQGRYVAVAGDCVSCHSRPGGRPFSGGLPLSTEFGTLYTPNITPDSKTGIGAWTEAELTRALHEGIGKHSEHLYPVFPYTSYTKISGADVHALYTYLQSLAPVSYAPPENRMKFPFAFRPLIFFWKKFFFTEGQFVADSRRSPGWNRGAYLVEGLGHCGECHSPRNSLGGLRTEFKMTGGSYIDEVRDAVDDQKIVPQSGLFRPWSAVNLTGSSAGIGSWSGDAIYLYLKTGHNNRAGAFGPMATVVSNSTSRLTNSDLRAMAEYLKLLPSREQSTGTAALPGQISAGEIVYTAHCGDCHLPTGLGVSAGPDADPTKTAPPLAGSAVVQAADPASLINVILYGAHESTSTGNTWPKMPGFQNEISLDDDQIAALASYVRSQWGNRGAAVGASDVAKQR